MIATSLFTWWYGRGWAQVAASLPRRLRSILNIFSVGTLLKTLFAPWRRIVSYPGRSLNEHFRSLVDNLISRLVGLVVRLLVLLVAILALAIIFILSVIELVAWPLLPPAAVFGLVKGLL